MIWLLHPHFWNKGEYQTIRPWKSLLRPMLVWTSNQRHAKWMTFYWISNFEFSNSLLVSLDDVGFCQLPINHFHANAEVSWESLNIIFVLQFILNNGLIKNVPLNAISINILWTSHVQRYRESITNVAKVCTGLKASFKRFLSVIFYRVLELYVHYK